MWPNPQETAHLVTFTEEILNGKLLFFCAVSLVIPFSYDHGSNASNFDQFIGYLNSAFTFAANLLFLLNCMIWDASGENKFIMSLRFIRMGWVFW